MTAGAPGFRALSRPLKMGTSARVPSIAALLGIVLIWSIASTALAVAHESWINRGGYRNSAGEWLCGVTERETPGQIAVTGKAKGVVDSWLVQPKRLALRAWPATCPAWRACRGYERRLRYGWH